MRADEMRIKKMGHGWDAEGRDMLRDMLKAVVTKTHVEVLSYAVALTRNENEALDIYQEAVVRAFEHADAIRDPNKVPAWLKTTIRNLVFERYRGVRVQSLDQLEIDIPEGYRHPENQSPSVDELVEAHSDGLDRARRSLEFMIPKLTPAMATFVRAVVEHGTREAVCEALAITPHEFRSYLSRLRKALVEFGVISRADIGPDPSAGFYPPDFGDHPLAGLFYDISKARSIVGWEDEPRDRLWESLAAVRSDERRSRIESLLAANSLVYVLFLHLFRDLIASSKA